MIEEGVQEQLQDGFWFLSQVLSMHTDDWKRPWGVVQLAAWISFVVRLCSREPRVDLVEIAHACWRDPDSPLSELRLKLERSSDTRANRPDKSSRRFSWSLEKPSQLYDKGE